MMTGERKNSEAVFLIYQLLNIFPIGNSDQSLLEKQ